MITLAVKNRHLCSRSNARSRFGALPYSLVSSRSGPGWARTNSRSKRLRSSISGIKRYLRSYTLSKSGIK